MKETLYNARGKKVPIIFPYEINLSSADGKTMRATIEDTDNCYELWLYIPSTREKAKLLEFTTAITIGVVLGEVERKYESVFAHVVHHRLTIPYTPGKDIYHDIPPFP